jgi:hypothetical protein
MWVLISWSMTMILCCLACISLLLFVCRWICFPIQESSCFWEIFSPLITHDCQFQSCESSCYARCNPFAHLHSTHPWSWWSCKLPTVCCSIQHDSHSLECIPIECHGYLHQRLMQLLSSHTDLQRTLTDGNLQWLCYLSSTGKLKQCIHL